MTDSLDPGTTNAFTAALAWFEGSLLGTIAITVAIIAVTSVGFLMLSGRVDVRRAAQVVFGCFIIFGASSVANGIVGALSGTGAELNFAMGPPPPPVMPQSPAYPKANATPYDPYAGAALPPR